MKNNSLILEPAGNSLKNLQKDAKLRIDGLMYPKGETETDPEKRILYECARFFLKAEIADMKNCCFKVFLYLLLGMYSSSAFADEYMFKVRHDGQEQVSSCVLQAGVCFVKMMLPLANDDLNVGIKVLHPYAEFKFAIKDEELSTAPQGWDQLGVNFHEANPVIRDVTLYRISPDAKKDRGIGRSLVLRSANTKFMDLEIEILAKDQPLQSKDQNYNRAEHEF